MSSLGTFKSNTPRSREKKAQNPKPQILGNETLSTKTPQKSEKFSGRARNRNVTTEAPNLGPDESPKKKCVGRSEKLPEKYEILSELFNGLDTSIRLLREPVV